METPNFAKPDPNWVTGARFREPNIKDWHLEAAPGVAEQLETGVPDSFMVLPKEEIKVFYDQVGPSCVANADCGAKTIEDFFDGKRWVKYDADELYRACGGDGIHGIFTDRSLAYARDVGCLEVGTQTRRKIAGYAFAPQSPGEWRRTLAAALVSTGPAVLATPLPSVFGWDSNEVATSAYHQMMLLGYEGLGDGGKAVLLNSWPAPRFVRLTWRYLEGLNFQDRFVYGYQMIDVDDLEDQPAPDPPIGTVKFGALLTKMSRKRLEFTLDAAAPGLANCRGHRLDFTQPVAFTAKAKKATPARLVVKVKDAELSEFTEGRVHVELKVA